MTVVSEHMNMSDQERNVPHIHELPEIAAVTVNPFDRSQPKKGHWLLTTAVTGITGLLVIGGTVLGTFGLGSEGHASAVDHMAATKDKWQQRTKLSKEDRENLKFDFSGLVGKRQESQIIAEKAYKRVAVAFANPTPGSDIKSTIPSGVGGGGPNLSNRAVDPNIIYKPSIKKPHPRKQANINPGDAETLIGLRGGKDNAVDAQDNSLLSNLGPDASGGSSILPKNYGLNPIEDIPQKELTISMGAGSQLKNQLVKRGLDPQYSSKLLSTLETVYSSRKIKRGQKIHLTYEEDKNKKGKNILKPVRLAMLPTPSREISIELDTDDKFYAHINGTRVSQTPENASKRAKARIRKSLYLAAKEQGIPENIIIKMMRVHAYEVDFQRQVRPGDSFEVFYGQDLSQKRKKAGPDVVLYSALILSGKKKSYYRYTTSDDGITDYYDIKGKSATRFLTRTPIEGARITSGYGMRRHPILRYKKMHTGVDFVAPYGTPIKAAGHGVIERSGRAGGYGRQVRIQHRNGYMTTYSHMSRIHRKMKKGVKVKQGDVIGYLGNSGQSTAAHLHYEILVNKRFVNPMSLRLPTGRQLKGKMLAKFKKERGRIVRLMNSAPMVENVADR